MTALSQRDRRLAKLLFAISLFTYAYFQCPLGWNQNTRFDLVRSIVEHGRLDIDEYASNTGDKAKLGDHFYSDKAPGVSLLAVPGYAIFHGALRVLGRPLPSVEVFGEADFFRSNRSFRDGLEVTTLFAVSIWSALAVALLFVLARRCGVDVEAALLAALAFGFGSLAFPYSTTLFGHQTCGALLFIGFFAAFRIRRREWSSRWAEIGCGFALGYAVVTEFPAAVPATMIVAYLVARTRAWRTAALCALGALPPALLLAGYNTLCFGRPWGTGYAHVAAPEFAAGMSQGLMGITYPHLDVLWNLLFGSFRGLLLLCPVVAVGALALSRLRKRGFSDEALLVAGVVAFYWLLNGSYWLWDGGSSLGPRHMIPMLSFLCLPIAAVGRGRLRRATWLLLGYSIATMLVATAKSPQMPQMLGAWDYVWLRGHFGRHGNLGLRVGLVGVASLVPLLVAWAAAGRAIVSTLRTAPLSIALAPRRQARVAAALARATKSAI